SPITENGAGRFRWVVCAVPPGFLADASDSVLSIWAGASDNGDMVYVDRICVNQDYLVPDCDGGETFSLMHNVADSSFDIPAYTAVDRTFTGVPFARYGADVAVSFPSSIPTNTTRQVIVSDGVVTLRYLNTTA